MGWRTPHSGRLSGAPNGGISGTNGRAVGRCLNGTAVEAAPGIGGAQAALRFCLAFPAVSAVIPGILSPTEADQNAAAVLSVADRSFVMRGGRIVLHGAAAALRGDPALADAFLGG